MHPYMDERNMFGGNRAEMEASANAREAARVFGYDYVSGQLDEAEARGFGLNPAQEASYRLADEARVIEQMQRHAQTQASWSAPSRPVIPTSPTKSFSATERLAKRSISQDDRVERNLRALQVAYDSIDRKLAQDPPLLLNSQETAVRILRDQQKMIDSYEPSPPAECVGYPIDCLDPISIISAICVGVSIGMAVCRLLF